jgi:hypothetical protein
MLLGWACAGDVGVADTRMAALHLYRRLLLANTDDKSENLYLQAMRDPVVFRCNAQHHWRTGSKWKVQWVAACPRWQNDS